jgi:hypothetical protein
LQASPGEDGLDGRYYSAAKAAELQMAPDPETLPGHREALSARARVVPSFDLGPVTLMPGGSAQYSVIDREEIPVDEDTVLPAVTGSQLVAGGELSVKFWRAKVFGEYLAEQLSDDFAGEELDRAYILAGATVDVVDRDTVWFRKVRLNGSYQVATYDPEQVDETFLTGQVHLRLNELIGFTSEYVRWEMPQLEDSVVVNRIEWILHVYY